MQEKEIELLDSGSNKCCRVAALSQPKLPTLALAMVAGYLPTQS